MMQTLMRTVLATSLGLLFCSASAFTAAAEQPRLEKANLFTTGDFGYRLYHIPGVLVTAKGTVLAWGEARSKTFDWAGIDILLRRSTDGGKTFSEAQKVAQVEGPKQKNPVALPLRETDPNEVTYNNPVFIADRDGTVHFLFCLEYMRCFYARSTDDGQTWSKPVEITDTFNAFRKTFDWKVIATGPNHAIQLRNGRLVVPVWLSKATGSNAHGTNCTATIYSDDHGQTWHAGDIAVPYGGDWRDSNEATAVQLADGSVMLNTRNASKINRRVVTISPDGATNWSAPHYDDALLEPQCMASLVRYCLAEDGGGKNILLFSNPDNLSRADGKEEPGRGRDRKNLTVQLSFDEGKTWPVKRVLEPGYSGYSDLAVGPDGTIYCFYGSGAPQMGGAWAFEHLTLARFNLAWLEAGQSVSATEDEPASQASGGGD